MMNNKEDRNWWANYWLIMIYIIGLITSFGIRGEFLKIEKQLDTLIKIEQSKTK